MFAAPKHLLAVTMMTPQDSPPPTTTTAMEKETEAQDGDAAAEEELFANSTDHRTVVFRNTTDVWVRLESTMRLGGNMVIESRAVVGPKAEHKWRFLGESNMFPVTPATCELLGIIPDNYCTAYSADASSSSYTWKASVVGEVNPVLLGGKESLSLKDLPKLGPMEGFSVDITRKRASSLQLLAHSRILISCGKSCSSSPLPLRELGLPKHLGQQLGLGGLQESAPSLK